MKKIAILAALSLASCSKCITCKQITTTLDAGYNVTHSDTSLIVVCDKKTQKYFGDYHQDQTQNGSSKIIQETFCN